MCATSHSFREGRSGTGSLLFPLFLLGVGVGDGSHETDDGSHLLKMTELHQPGALNTCVKASLLLKLHSFNHCIALFIVAFSSLIQGLSLFHLHKVINIY